MVTVTQQEMPLPPTELTTCANLPQIPPDKANDLIIATFIDNAYTAASDCKTTLNELVVWINTTHAEIASGNISSKLKEK